MTKEELEVTIGTLRTFSNEQATCIERLEKEIKSLGERCLQLQKDKGNLIDRCRELEAQIEKMKCCYNCSKWYYGECEESPKSKTFFCADFKCDNWEIADD